MQDPQEQFAVITITRADIAEALNEPLYNGVTDPDDNGEIITPEDDRLTNEFCLKYVSSLKACQSDFPGEELFTQREFEINREFRNKLLELL